MPASQPAQSPFGNQPHCLCDDPALHLRLTVDPVTKYDRHFDDPKPATGGPPGQLYLKTVSRCLAGFGAEFREPGGPVGPESGGGVADPQSEHQSSVKVSAARENPSVNRPIRGRPARNVPASNRQVGQTRSEGINQPRQIGRVMGEVRIHLTDHFGTAGQRVGEADGISRTETLFHRSMDDFHQLIRSGEPIGEGSGPIRGAIVDDEQPVAVSQNGGSDCVEILTLVVRRDYDRYLVGSDAQKPTAYSQSRQMSFRLLASWLVRLTRKQDEQTNSSTRAA